MRLPRKFKMSTIRTGAFELDLDIDGDGQVTEEEKLLSITVIDAFNKFDEDGDNSIDYHEFQDLVADLDLNVLSKVRLRGRKGLEQVVEPPISVCETCPLNSSNRSNPT